MDICGWCGGVDGVGGGEERQLKTPGEEDAATATAHHHRDMNAPGEWILDAIGADAQFEGI